MLVRYFLCFSLLLISYSIFGQTTSIKNISWTVHSTRLIISYDLGSEQLDQGFEIVLLLNNGLTTLHPTKGISGAIGKNIYPGKKKTIQWWYVHNGYEKQDLNDLSVLIKVKDYNIDQGTDRKESKSLNNEFVENNDLKDLVEIVNFSPGISAVTLEKNSMELSWFNAYTFNQDVFNFGSPPFRKLESKQTGFISTLRWMYGMSSEKNFDMGIDLTYASSKISELGVSFFKASPRIRWRPLGALGESLDITLQHSLGFILADKDNLFTGKPELSNQLLITNYQVDNNLMFLLNLGIEFQTKSSINTFDRKRPLSFPMSFFIGYYPRTDLTFFTGIEHRRELGTVPWVEETTRFLRRIATNWTLGAQYLLNNQFNLFISTSIKLADKNGGGFHSFSFGGSMLLIK